MIDESVVDFGEMYNRLKNLFDEEYRKLSWYQKILFKIEMFRIRKRKHEIVDTWDDVENEMLLRYKNGEIKDREDILRAISGGNLKHTRNIKYIRNTQKKSKVSVK